MSLHLVGCHRCCSSSRQFLGDKLVMGRFRSSEWIRSSAACLQHVYIRPVSQNTRKVGGSGLRRVRVVTFTPYCVITYHARLFGLSPWRLQDRLMSRRGQSLALAFGMIRRRSGVPSSRNATAIEGSAVGS
jgi:hypothetical protein